MWKDIHEIFWASFPDELHEWISRLAEKKTYFQEGVPTEWTP
jgi:hypothetical protein